MKITIDMPAQRIADLMITAIETGIGHWASDVQVYAGLDTRTPYGEASSYEGSWHVKGTYPLTNDGSETDTFFFSAETFARNAVMAPWALADWINENEDAGSADVLFQCAAFGGVVFG
ncbi:MULTISPECIES: hypothetical protein [unclassified Mameliella]|uniref:hypothetical protein n=1 Tax=Mameliella sp. LZ-28 TaxID=2484146 RepID=UPI00143F52DD|nr:hypothetical protein [Mameliella sp. LZ-28]MCR9276230.1 hypothetical protein [Paracoccaceae bacterium]